MLLSMYGARGSVEPMVGLAVRLRELGAEVRMCAPPDEEFAELSAGAGVPLVPVGAPVRPLVTTVVPGSAAGLARRMADLMDAQFGTMAAVAEGCDVLVATGPLPVTASARSVAEKLGARYVHASHTPVILPSPHQPPPARRGRPLPPGVKDNRALWELDARNANEMFGAALNARRAAAGLPPVAHVRDYAFTGSPWLATDPVLSPCPPTDLDVVQTGTWIRRDERPLAPGLVAFLEAGEPPVYVGFGSTPLREPVAVARAAVAAARALGRRVVLSRGWAGLDPVDGDEDCFAVDEVNHQALFARVAAVVHHGSAGTTATAARAGAPQVVVPQGADQPYWAGRVAELGIGAAHDGPVPTAESLSEALQAVLTPGTRDRARAVAGLTRTDGTPAAARRLLDAV
ncbi:glycosyltransferase [Streptomyces tritici]|uniref:glycosyltransferase n=1 Tax=Streptomyces tritici TaxID=2054410 RepID=UPI003AF0DAEC